MTSPQSYLSAAQVDLLMRDLHESRVLSLDGAAYVAHWDVRAMLTRVFGFGRWSMTLNEPTTLVYETDTTLKNGKPGVRVAYRASVNLLVCAPDGTPLASYDATSIGEAPAQPDYKRGDAHDSSAKVAESQALKRCAMNLGSQMGLSLYANTRRDVIRVLAFDPREAGVDQAEAVEVALDEPVHDDEMLAGES